jgi:plastocyanin
MRIITLALIMMTTACAADEHSNTPQPASAPQAANSSVVRGTAPKNAVVALVPAVPMPAEGPAVMDQYAKQFVPNVLYVQVGQPVEFRNSEDMPHNVTVMRRGTGSEVFNVGTEPHQKYVHTFDRIGQFDVTCDIHPGMQATLIAAPSPFATIADDNGRFSIPNVKPGPYTLSATYEGRTIEQPLEVSGATTEVTIR